MIQHKTLPFIFFGLAFFMPVQAEEGFQSLDSIYDFVKTTITANLSPDSVFEVKVLPLDRQLQLPHCNQPLETYNAKAMRAGRTSIGVRCNADKKWSIFVAAVIQEFQTVIVLTRPVRRGETITREHIALENQDVTSTRGDYLRAVEAVENKEAARNMLPGVILGAKSVIEPPLIKRHDKVVISTGQLGFSVQMSGTAMADGASGQSIKVRNDSSGRVVSGTVVDAGVILVK